MLAKVQKWGNSQGVRIPKSILENANISTDEELEIKGKIQSSKADAVKKINDKKDEILEKVNKKIEDMDDKK